MQTGLSRKQIQRVYSRHFTDGNRVTLLWRDREYFQSISSVIENAKETVCLAFYIFRNDETGIALAEILKKKAAEGVRIMLLYDHFGSLFTPAGFWKELEAHGIRIAASRPFKWTMPLHYVHRDHRKLIIVDGSVAFTGGLNIADEYRGRLGIVRRKAWRDTGVMLEGPVVRELRAEFGGSWLIWTREEIAFASEPQVFDNGLAVLPIFSSSARGRRRMRKLLSFCINSAQQEICLTTAYFTPSWRVMHLLEQAVSRGVSVRILVPGRSDVSAAHFAGRAFFSRLLKSGVEIHTYNGEILHSKTAVFDGQWSIIGSANLDFQSLRRNDEGNVGILNPAFGAQMRAMFEEDLKLSDRIQPEVWKKRSLTEKIREQFFALFRRRL